MVRGAQVELVWGVGLVGRVVDADTGGPVPGVRLYPYEPLGTQRFGPLSAGGRTDPEGVYRLRAPPGPVEVVTSRLPPAYAATYPRGVTVKVEVPPDVNHVTVPTIRLKASPVPADLPAGAGYGPGGPPDTTKPLTAAPATPPQEKP
jgi:hypothetical protein